MILYELLTGRRPFEGPITKVLGMISFAAPPLPSSHCPGLDPALEIICLKAMAKKPENRYASMDEFAVALRGWLEDGPPLECGSLLPHTTRAGGRPRFPIRVWVAAALAVAALVFGIIYVATDKGRIKIEVNDPNAIVFVDGKNVRIEGVGEPITLRAGEHSLTIKRGEVEVKAETFVVRRGDNEPLRITLEAPAREKLPEQPMPPAVASGDPPTLAKPAHR